MYIRRKYIVHRRFQTDFSAKVLIAILVPMISSCLFVIAFLQFSGWMNGDGLQGFMGEGFVLSFLLRVLPVGFVILVFSVLFSHRIAGPVKKMQNACDNLAEGHPAKHISLRKNDYFKSLAAKLNEICRDKSSE